MKYIFKYKSKDFDIIINITNNKLTIIKIFVTKNFKAFYKFDNYNTNVVINTNDNVDDNSGVIVQKGICPIVAIYNPSKIRIWISSNGRNIFNESCTLSEEQIRILLCFFIPILNTKLIEIL